LTSNKSLVLKRKHFSLKKTSGARNVRFCSYPVIKSIELNGISFQSSIASNHFECPIVNNKTMRKETNGKIRPLFGRKTARMKVGVSTHHCTYFRNILIHSARLKSLLQLSHIHRGSTYLIFLHCALKFSYLHRPHFFSFHGLISARSFSIKNKIRTLAVSPNVPLNHIQPPGPGPTIANLAEKYPVQKCWSCQHFREEKNTLFCNSCEKIQLAPPDADHFELFGL
jgi:hypothetical protein